MYMAGYRVYMVGCWSLLARIALFPAPAFGPQVTKSRRGNVGVLIREALGSGVSARGRPRAPTPTRRWAGCICSVRRIGVGTAMDLIMPGRRGRVQTAAASAAERRKNVVLRCRSEKVCRGARRRFRAM